MTEYYIKIVYANITKDHPSYTSLNSHFSSIEYFVDTWIEPKVSNSKLFIFPNMRTAFEYMERLSTPFSPVTEPPFQGKMLWWCEAKNVQKPVYLPPLDPSREYGKLYWDTYPYNPSFHKNKKKDYFGLKNILFADAIKLFRMVSLNEIERIMGYNWPSLA